MELALRFPDGCSNSIASCMCIEKDLLYGPASRSAGYGPSQCCPPTGGRESVVTVVRPGDARARRRPAAHPAAPAPLERSRA